MAPGDSGDAVLKDWLEKIERFGVAFVEGTPATPEATQAVARRAAYIRETIFGGYYDFTANMEHKDTAYTSMAIGPHTDGTYSFDAPGYQMFHLPRPRLRRRRQRSGGRVRDRGDHAARDARPLSRADRGRGHRPVHRP
jgi:hypothetical protein